MNSFFNIPKSSNIINSHNVFFRQRSRCKFHIKDIFDYYWEDFVFSHPNFTIRDVVFENIDRFLKCKTFKLGYTMYECEHCDNYLIVPHTCKSRFCSSCGVKYGKARVIEASSKCMKTKHRHLVFTIPEELRSYFLADRTMLNLLFEAVNETITWIWNNPGYRNKQSKCSVNKRHKKVYRTTSDACLVPGYISVIHAFGRDLKWNPHIHVLITEGGLRRNSKRFVKRDHFNYESYRKTFQRILLDKMYKRIGRSFYWVKCKMYKTHNNGFYVRAAKQQFKNIKKGIEYVLRYAGRPVMAESRITNVDYERNEVSYYYEDHKTNKRVDVTESVFSFIAKLIRHIPDKNFITVRYYGIYSNKNHYYKEDYPKMYTNKEIKTLRDNLYWAKSILVDFNYNVLNCECGHVMSKTYSYIIDKREKEGYREIFYVKEKPFKINNWQSLTGYSPDRY